LGFFPSGTYDLFLTHNWYYTDPWQQLVGMIDDELPGKWRNWSLPWHDTSIERHTEKGKAQLEKLLRGQISMTAMVVVVSENAGTTDGRMWLDIQLRMAGEYAKPVIGVRTADGGFPDALAPRVQEVVERTAAAIVTAADRRAAPAGGGDAARL
jgi:hypothetical protein